MVNSNILQFKRVSIEDKDFLNSFLKPYNLKTHEFCFTNLYMWSEYCRIEYAVYKNCLIIKKRDALSFEDYFMQPVNYEKSNFQEIIDLIIGLNKKYKFNYLFRDAEELFVKDLEELYPGMFKIDLDRDNSDYIFLKKDIAEYKKHKLHSKKRQMNQFIRNYKYNFTEINVTNIPDCIKFGRNIMEKKDADKIQIYEMNANIDLLSKFSQFDLIGVAVYVDSKVIGYIVGEKLNDLMVVVHIQKADTDYKGVYAFLKHMFASSENLDGIEFINEEQDLGVETLRNAKSQYCPVKLEPKYTVVLKN
ncbi:DUF2156 domain-containing protein [Candidatus Dependentiae bacterium]|nr:DUF2156 domain-containing protein [Candidatus Dependentiae bacterium]